MVPSDRILDLVFSSDPLITAFVDVLPLIPGCGHCPVVATGFFKSDPPVSPPSRTFYDWFRADFGSISKAIDDIDWIFQFSSRSLNECYTLFESTLHHLTNLYVPIKHLTSTKHKKWNKHTPNRLRKLKSKAWFEFKTTRNRHGRHSPLTYAR